MEFVKPPARELASLRADPLLQEQELDVRPQVAEDIERALGFRAGRAYWRSDHDHLYAIELGDLGRGRPSTATVYGFWDRYEPRPPEHEIDADLLAFLIWFASQTRSLDPADVQLVAQFAQRQTGGVQVAWPTGSVLRTPEERFSHLHGFPYVPKYAEIEGLRMAYLDEGTGDVVLLLHGQWAWGFTFRLVVPKLSQSHRVIVPGLIGYGRSDKPVADNAYSLRSHARWLRKLILSLDLKNITLVGHDVGGMIGLRVVSRIPERFSRVVAVNTGIPDGVSANDAFKAWRNQLQRGKNLNPRLVAAERQGYESPFPSPEYEAGPRVMPRLIPTHPGDAGAYDNRAAIDKLKTLDIPLLPICTEHDVLAPAVGALASIFRKTAPVKTIKGAGHFVHEDAPDQVIEAILEWMKRGT
jgi:haloalkane dehalogenase